MTKIPLKIQGTKITVKSWAWRHTPTWRHTPSYSGGRDRRIVVQGQPGKS
jgi:hypothetical protein